MAYLTSWNWNLSWVFPAHHLREVGRCRLRTTGAGRHPWGGPPAMVLGLTLSRGMTSSTSRWLTGCVPTSSQSTGLKQKVGVSSLPARITPSRYGESGGGGGDGGYRMIFLLNKYFCYVQRRNPSFQNNLYFMANRMLNNNASSIRKYCS